MSLTKPMYSKPPYVKTPSKTQFRKETARLRRELKAGLNGPDAVLYKMMMDALNMVKN